MIILQIPSCSVQPLSAALGTRVGGEEKDSRHEEVPLGALVRRLSELAAYENSHKTD